MGKPDQIEILLELVVLQKILFSVMQKLGNSVFEIAIWKKTFY
jgi:hypothetical protein